MNQLAEVKKASQDYEWYPTDNRTIDVLANDIKERLGFRFHGKAKILDIGAGNGKVLKGLEERFESVRDISPKCYAIEKSAILLNSLPTHFFIMGTDFDHVTLLDKELDVIFCNPPYSQYERWSEKIIKEARSKMVYLLIPERWKNSEVIKAALKNRDVKAEVIHSFDFAEAEDRPARAKAELLVIQFGQERDNPFRHFFDQHFTYPEEIELDIPEREEEESLVSGMNLIDRLVFFYDRRIEEILSNYKAVCSLDAGLLMEFGITKGHLIGSLEEKIQTTKKFYWSELFSNLDKIYNRLTKKSRDIILGLVNDQTGIDFNRDNVYAVVSWVVRKANEFFDQQLIDLYRSILTEANAENYKSNKRVFKREQFGYGRYYERDYATHVKIKTGNRIVIEGKGGISSNKWYFQRGLKEAAADFIGDILTVANNLGFVVVEPHPRGGEWDDSEAKVYTFVRDGERQTLLTVRAFLNGNLHFTFNNLFVHKLNVQAGKLLGWIGSQDEVSEVVPDEDLEKCKDFFNFSLHIGTKQLLLA